MTNWTPDELGQIGSSPKPQIDWNTDVRQDSRSGRYDRPVQDLRAGDQFRSAHGKGVRAILRTAFTLGPAQVWL
jgi:hypothetical protein